MITNVTDKLATPSAAQRLLRHNDVDPKGLCQLQKLDGRWIAQKGRQQQHPAQNLDFLEGPGRRIEEDCI